MMRAPLAQVNAARCARPWPSKEFEIPQAARPQRRKHALRVGPIGGQLSDVAQRFMISVSSDRDKITHHPVSASIKGSGIARGALTMSPRTEEQLRRRAPPLPNPPHLNQASA